VQIPITPGSAYVSARNNPLTVHSGISKEAVNCKQRTPPSSASKRLANYIASNLLLVQKWLIDSASPSPPPTRTPPSSEYCPLLCASVAKLQDLLKRPDNRVCADCHVNTHPRWASWSLGVFICIRCSGIHRGMGTHISRVKSADLDAWTDEQTEMMIKWGNRRANKYIPSLLSLLSLLCASVLCCSIPIFVTTKQDCLYILGACLC